jgi:hypothetical protein
MNSGNEFGFSQKSEFWFERRVNFDPGEAVGFGLGGGVSSGSTPRVRFAAQHDLVISFH